MTIQMLQDGVGHPVDGRRVAAAPHLVGRVTVLPAPSAEPPLEPLGYVHSRAVSEPHTAEPSDLPVWWLPPPRQPCDAHGMPKPGTGLRGGTPQRAGRGVDPPRRGAAHHDPVACGLTCRQSTRSDGSLPRARERRGQPPWPPAAAAVCAQPPHSEGFDAGATAFGTDVYHVVRGVAETVLGHRPVSQLRRWTSRDVYRMLADHPLRDRRRRFGANAAIRRLVTSFPVEDAAEALALVQDGARTRAIALRCDRLAEASRPRWVCTALQLG